jgi:arsenate reductase
MSTWKLYHNPHCSKSREALSLLETQAANFQIIDYLKTPPSLEELKEMIGQLDAPVSTLVRVKENDFNNAPFDVNSADEVAQQLSKKPHLMERPVLQGKGRAVIGRPLENIAALLNQHAKTN